jgi:hypothetical protein
VAHHGQFFYFCKVLAKRRDIFEARFYGAVMDLDSYPSQTEAVKIEILPNDHN